MVRITTARLRLRSWRATDLELYNEACNTLAVMRWLGGVQSAAELKRDVKYFMRFEERYGFTFWVIERLADKQLLGFCGLIRITEKDCPFRGSIEIGWRIREDCWREGYGFEAASAVLERGFDGLQLDAIVSRAAAGNKASRALMKKLGLRRRRDMDYRPRGECDKLAVFSIGAEEWRHARESCRRRR
jgi:RimJ/RimL family protein N-acetyltransferase